MADTLRLHTPAADPHAPGRLTVADPAAPLVADAKALAKLLGLGLRTIRTYDTRGLIPKPVKLGSRVVWRLDEIRAWLATGAPDRATWDALRAARK